MQIAGRCGNGASDGPSNYPRNRVCDFDYAVSCWSGFVEWCMKNYQYVEVKKMNLAMLDYCAGVASGVEIEVRDDGQLRAKVCDGISATWAPTRNWSQTEKLFDEVTALNKSSDGWWCHYGNYLAESCETPNIAVCKAAASSLGIEVAVPSVLVGVK